MLSTTGETSWQGSLSPEPFTEAREPVPGKPRLLLPGWSRFPGKQRRRVDSKPHRWWSRLSGGWVGKPMNGYSKAWLGTDTFPHLPHSSREEAPRKSVGALQHTGLQEAEPT